jgi:hypothetical protein
MPLISISDRTRVFEISAVILTAVGKFVFMDYLHWWFPFILAAIIFWACYIIYRSKRKPGITTYWGFRTDNFRKTIKIVLPFAIIALAGCICIGIFQDSLNITWHIIPLLILYPIWGTIQQFLVIGLTAGNLHDLKSPKIPKVLVIILASLLFGLIHYPFVWLIVGSFALAIFYGFIYLKQRNLYALGIFHGWLGAIFFYTVVNRDPFMEIFGRLLNNLN